MARDRTLFDRSARDYDAARPGYPEQLIDVLLQRSGIPESGRILEIGAGTGQLTAPLAERGYRMVAIELGENLSRLAAKNLDRYPNATVVCADFEQYDVEPGAYDLVVSAQAFHWIAPTIGYPKVYGALRPGGRFALVWNLFPGSDDRVYRDLDAAYRACAPQLCRAPGRRPLAEQVERIEWQIDASELFEPTDTVQVRWTSVYTTSRYLRLLRTYSDHLALDPSTLGRLLESVRSTLDRFGGTIDRPQISTLFLARRKQDGAATGD